MPLSICSTVVRALLLTIGCLVAVAAVAGQASAQSLADVAAREDARRKQVKSGKVYTNKDLKPSDRPEPAAGAGEAAASGSEAPGLGAAAAQTEGAGAEGGEGTSPEAEDGEERPRTEEEERAHQEQQWRGRMKEARGALERSQMFAEALQSRVNALWADFTARDDPAQRAVIDAERKKALAQLDRVKAEIVAQTKAIADIEEEARRAGVPPGWLR